MNTRSASTPKRGCGALIVNDKDEALLLRRSSRARNDHNLWSQPGGAIEDDCGIEEHVTREIREEIGVEIAIAHFLTATLHGDPPDHWVAYSYLARIIEGAPRLCEPDKHGVLSWFSLASPPANINAVTLASIRALRSLRTTRRSSRPEGIIILDMDGTLLPGTTANVEMAKILKQESLVEALEKGFTAGLLNSTDYAAKVINMYKNINLSNINDAFTNAPKLSYLREFVQWAKCHNFVTTVITTSPSFFANKFIEAYGFDRVYAADFSFEEGIAINNYTLLHAEDKPRIAAALCAEFNVAPDQCYCIGDSTSDLPLFAAFPKSIGLNASELVNTRAERTLSSLCALDLVPIIDSWRGRS